MTLAWPAWLALPPLHLQRPLWLWALCLLPLGWLLWQRRRREAWRDAVDPHLLARLLEPGRDRGGWRVAGLSLAWMLAVLALAGPGWRQEPQPRWAVRAPLVIALDLSSSILAPDLPPSRLAQARAKIGTLLRARRGGEAGLVVWAGDAHTVAPLTADAANIVLFLDTLAPDLMPADGHRPERALTHAATLLHQAGFAHGEILLLTGHADDGAAAIAAGVAAQGYRVSVLGLGTAAGAMYRDASGTPRPARLDEASLRALAAAGGGRYARLGIDTADLQALGVLWPPAEPGRGGSGGEPVWLDQGYWLLPPLLVLVALLLFRRGAGVLAALPLALLLATPGQAVAAADGGWWRRPDQQAQARLERGVDAYRRGEFDAAGEAFDAAAGRGADAAYNLGNALARQGRYEEALAAYDRALAQAPGMEDALANRRVVEAAHRRQQERQQGAQDRAGGEPQSRREEGQGQGGEAQDGSPAQPAPADAPGQPQDASGTGTAAEPPADPPPAAMDQQAGGRQEEADRDQREAMQQALEQGGQDDAGEAQAPPAADAQAREQRQAREAWLRRVPDDPGGLLRARFRLEHERRQREDP